MMLYKVRGAQPPSLPLLLEVCSTQRVVARARQRACSTASAAQRSRAVLIRTPSRSGRGSRTRSPSLSVSSRGQTLSDCHSIRSRGGCSTAHSSARTPGLKGCKDRAAAGFFYKLKTAKAFCPSNISNAQSQEVLWQKEASCPKIPFGD